MPIRACPQCHKARTNYDVAQCEEKDCELKDEPLPSGESADPIVIGTASAYGFPESVTPTPNMGKRRGRPPKNKNDSQSKA